MTKLTSIITRIQLSSLHIRQKVVHGGTASSLLLLIVSHALDAYRVTVCLGPAAGSSRTSWLESRRWTTDTGIVFRADTFSAIFGASIVAHKVFRSLETDIWMRNFRTRRGDTKVTVSMGVGETKGMGAAGLLRGGRVKMICGEGGGVGDGM